MLMKLLNMIKNLWIELKIGVSLLFLSLFPSKESREKIIEQAPIKKQPCGPNCKCNTQK
jgi:hypothetical protein